MAAHTLQLVITVHVHRAVFVLNVHDQCVNDVHIDQETVIVKLAVVGHEVEQTANDASGEHHITVLLDRNQLIHRINIDNLRIAEHEKLASCDFQIIRGQIQRSVVRFGFQLDVIVIFLFDLIIKILRNFATITDLVIVDVIFDEAAGGKVNHHRLDVQRRLVEPAYDIFDGKILITGTVEQLPQCVKRIDIVVAGDFVHHPFLVVVL